MIVGVGSSDVPCPQLLSVPGVKLPVTSSSVLISGREASSKIESAGGEESGIVEGRERKEIAEI